MEERRNSWRETIRAFGEAVIEVLRAEVAVVGETWKRSGRELAKVLGLAVAVAYLGLIMIPTLLLFALLTGLHSGLGWPLWGAALAVVAVAALVALVLVRVAIHLMTRRFESPVATVKHRFADHVEWWNERVLSDGKTEGGADEALDTGDRESGEPTPGA